MSSFATVDTSEAVKVCRELSQLSGTSLPAVMLTETGRILSRCIGLTRSAKTETIKRQVAFHNRNLWEETSDPKRRHGAPIVSFTKAGTGWFIDESNARPGQEPKGKRIGSKSFHLMTEFFHWSNARWARYQRALEIMRAKTRSLTRALGSRGLAAHSWWKIGLTLGVTGAMDDVPNFVRNAAPVNGRERPDTRAFRKLSGPGNLLIEFENLNAPLVKGLGGARILQRAIDGRIGYFNTSMARGAFDDVRRAAQRYRGVFVA
jgi:hypothetical protein